MTTLNRLSSSLRYWIVSAAAVHTTICKPTFCFSNTAVVRSCACFGSSSKNKLQNPQCNRRLNHCETRYRGTQQAFGAVVAAQDLLHGSIRRPGPSFHNSRRNMSLQTDTSSKSTPFKVALLQFKVTEDKLQNIETAGKYLKEAHEKGATLSVLPEIWNSPYATAAFPEYAEVVPNVGESPTDEEAPSVDFLINSAKEYNMWIIGGSIPEIDRSSDENEKPRIYNTCICLSPEGNIVAKHRKVHLFDIDVPGKITFRESDTLTGGSTVSTFDLPPIGGSVGVGICYDIRFPELAQCMVESRGCKVLVYPGAFNLTTGPLHWELLQRARAVDNQCFVLTASPARSDPPTIKGKYPHYSAWGHSTAVSPWGDIIATCDEQEGIVMADLDMSLVDDMRSSIPTSGQKRNDLYELKDITREK